MELVLASTSRYRRALIDRLGLRYTAAAPACDEDALKPALRGRPVPAVALALAEAKARSLAETFPDALIVGSDQIPEVDGEGLDKPGDAARAVAQLERLAGRSHRLHTAVFALHPRSGRAASFVDTHELVMRPWDREALARYVARDAPLDCAGAYRIEGAGIALFEAVRGEDFTAIVGLPLARLTGLLLDFGLRVL